MTRRPIIVGIYGRGRSRLEPCLTMMQLADPKLGRPKPGDLRPQVCLCWKVSASVQTRSMSQVKTKIMPIVFGALGSHKKRRTLDLSTVHMESLKKALTSNTHILINLLYLQQVYIYIYIYIYIYACLATLKNSDGTKQVCLWMTIYIYIYIYREREREIAR